MADKKLSIVAGDSVDYVVTVQDDARPPNKIDLSKAVDGAVSRPAIIRFAVKEDPSVDSNEDALVFKTSYVASEIAPLAQSGATLGQCNILIDKADTEDIEVGEYRWDIEVTRQDALRTSAGTVTCATGSKSVTGVGTNFLLAKVGDVFQPLGVLNTKPAIITKIVSATVLEIETSALLVTEAAVAFEIRRGRHKTAQRGPFEVLEGVVDK